MEWLSDVLRYIFLFLDSIVYSLIGKAYELFMDIAATNIFADGTITKFANRVYALLAIFMLFRLSFSILTYIVNPDSASDKSTGGGKLIGNVLITIILLISVPWGFKQVIKLQNELLKDNIVGKIILGVGFDSSSNTSSTTTNTSSITNQLAPGDEMAWTVFTAFFYPDKEECEDSIKSLEVSADCKTALGNYGDTYQRITKSRLVNAIIGSGLETARDTTTNEYIFEYTPLISTLVGGFVAYILILFCIQIAVRSVKLGVLELIAPIPVISYLDPKQGKDGMFKKWLKVCGKTFADLFIRLAAIYFAIFLISEITSGGGMENSLTEQKANFLVRVLIILGALMFAKDLPKFIEEITGIKLDGAGFSLNPMKTLATVPIAGALAARTIGGIDSKIHGNGFFHGFKNTDGVKLGGSKDKSILDTYDRQIRKEVNKKRDMTRPAYEGKRDVKKIDEKWNKGEKIRNKLGLNGQMKDGAGNDYFDGTTLANYRNVYGSSEFASSKMKLDHADNVRKQYEKALEQARYGGGVPSTGVTVDGKTYYDIGSLSEGYASAQKSVKGLEDVHNAMRNVHQKDAEMEDAIKFRKYNQNNPANV